MSITIKSNPDGVSGAVQVNGVDKVTIGASGITAGSFAPNSIDAAAAALAFSGANQSLASSGYQKLPSGLIIQWGTVSTNATGTSHSFPITFPSAVYALTATDGGDGSVEAIAVTIVSNSTFRAKSTSAAPGILFIAIGV